MGVDLFVYGTLEFAEIIHALTGRNFSRQTACLPGYGCYCIAGESYPGIIRQRGKTTYGGLLHGIDARSLEQLNRYEGPMYSLQRVRVIRGDGRRVWAYTYVLRKTYRRRLIGYRPWRRVAAR